MRRVNLKDEIRAVVYWLSFCYVILFTITWPSLRIALSVQRDGRPLNALEAKYGLAAIILQVFGLTFGYLTVLAKHCKDSRNLIRGVSGALIIPILFYSLDTPFVLGILSGLGLHNSKVVWSFGNVVRSLIPLLLLAVSLWVAFYRRIGMKEAFENHTKEDAH